MSEPITVAKGIQGIDWLGPRFWPTLQLLGFTGNT